MTNQIAEKRKLYGLKQEDLAKQLNVSVSTICRFETGKCKPRGKIAIQLSKILDIPLEELIV